MSEEFSLALDTSEDEAPPEEVRLEESRASALRSRKEALDTTRREKQELKEKRRRRHEVFQQQKERRLLPDDVLEEIGAARPPEMQPDEAGAEESDDEEESGDEGVEEEEVDPSGKIRTLQGGYTVRLTGELTLAAAQQRAAAAFLHDRFYGPGCGRTTNKKLLSLKNKKSRAPAVEFVTKGWAPKHRVKAERMKQRWLSRKQAAAF